MDTCGQSAAGAREHVLYIIVFRQLGCLFQVMCPLPKKSCISMLSHRFPFKMLSHSNYKDIFLHSLYL